MIGRPIQPPERDEDEIFAALRSLDERTRRRPTALAGPWFPQALIMRARGRGFIETVDLMGRIGLELTEAGRQALAERNAGQCRLNR